MVEIQRGMLTTSLNSLFNLVGTLHIRQHSTRFYCWVSEWIVLFGGSLSVAESEQAMRLKGFVLHFEPLLSLFLLKEDLLGSKAFLIHTNEIFRFRFKPFLPSTSVTIKRSIAGFLSPLQAFRRYIKPERRRFPDNEVSYMDHFLIVGISEAFNADNFVTFRDILINDFVSMVTSVFWGLNFRPCQICIFHDLVIFLRVMLW